MSNHAKLNENGPLCKALDTLLYLLAGSAMIVCSLSFLIWLRF